MTGGPQVVVGDGLRTAAPGVVLSLSADDVHHLRRVLRLSDGSSLRLTDGSGLVAPARLDPAGAEVVGPVARLKRPAPRLALAQALTRGRRSDDAVRTACELGVDLLVPVIAARTQGRPGATERTALVGRWRAIAAAALAQCQGAWAADVADAVEVPALVAAPPWAGPRLVAVPGADALPAVLERFPVGASADGTVGVAVGPEGGWSPEEVAAFTGAGWVPVGLGPTVLRSEHAGPAALAVIAAATGRWASGG